MSDSEHSTNFYFVLWANLSSHHYCHINQVLMEDPLRFLSWGEELQHEKYLILY